MKKIISLLVAAFMLLIIVTPQANAENVADSWATREAEITPYEYAHLYNNAGIATYVFTDYEVDLNPANLGDFEVVTEGATFIVVKKKYNPAGHRTLITEKGLAVTYLPKTTNENIGSRGYLIEDDNWGFYNTLQTAVKTFIGPTMTKAAYLNFENLVDNKLLTVNTNVSSQITIPNDAVINQIVAFDYYHSGVKLINKYTFTPGQTHSFNWNDGTVDNISIGVSRESNLYISYQSENHINYVLNNSDYQKYIQNIDLTNNFKPIFKDVKTSDWYHGEVSWAVLRGMIQGYENGEFRPYRELTESQLVSLLTKYYGIKTAADSNDYDMLGGYSYFTQFVALDGWKNSDKRNQPVTRGKVAQILSATLGGPTDQNGAINFLMEKDISTAKTVKEFNAAGTIKRSHISAFFKRMEDNGFKKIVK